jgi:2,3-bisphosphoglycerate-independent phosphoglycerate mutase
MDPAFLSRLAQPSDVDGGGRILLCVLDGLGGLNDPVTGKSEMETARLPNLDALAARSSLGLADPVGPGITPGSGPGHLALFGYDPVAYEIGRGALSAAGVNFPLEKGDVAARANFATLDAQGLIVDRRAGRIPTEVCIERCKLLGGIPGVFVSPEKDHRAVVVFRGKGLNPAVTDTDPQKTGVASLVCKARAPKGAALANKVNAFLKTARERLKGFQQANGMLLRGFDVRPALPSLQSLYGLKATAVASYPMYKGLARLAGMRVIEGLPDFEAELKALPEALATSDFVFLHYKPTDSAGEDWDFAKKVSVLEAYDVALPRILAAGADVVAVTGDHSTPAVMGVHSWHPVPFLLSSRWCRTEGAPGFSERACARGVLGRFPAKEGMALMLANAGRLAKYGA